MQTGIASSSLEGKIAVVVAKIVVGKDTVAVGVVGTVAVVAIAAAVAVASAGGESRF
jgi:hypothetical protein